MISGGNIDDLAALEDGTNEALLQQQCKSIW